MLKKLKKFADYNLLINGSDDYKAIFDHDKKQINIVNKGDKNG